MAAKNEVYKASSCVITVDCMAAENLLCNWSNEIRVQFKAMDLFKLRYNQQIIRAAWQVRL
jgi:hypothetical protein